MGITLFTKFLKISKIFENFFSKFLTQLTRQGSYVASTEFSKMFFFKIMSTENFFENQTFQKVFCCYIVPLRFLF